MACFGCDLSMVNSEPRERFKELTNLVATMLTAKNKHIFCVCFAYPPLAKISQ